jgi:hypothetical protein
MALPNEIAGAVASAARLGQPGDEPTDQRCCGADFDKERDGRDDA